MWICEACGGVCRSPRLRVYREVDPDGRERREPWCDCPFCGESALAPALPCEGGSGDCLGWRRQEEALCPACAQALEQEAAAFLRRLTPAQQQELDRRLEGRGVRQFL